MIVILDVPKSKGLTTACWGVMGKGGMIRKGGKPGEIVAGWQKEAAEEPAEEPARPVGSEELGCNRCRAVESELPDTRTGQSTGERRQLCLSWFLLRETGEGLPFVVSELAVVSKLLFPQLFCLWELPDSGKSGKRKEYLVCCYLEIVGMWRNYNKILFLSRWST